MLVGVLFFITVAQVVTKTVLGAQLHPQERGGPFPRGPAPPTCALFPFFDQYRSKCWSGFVPYGHFCTKYGDGFPLMTVFALNLGTLCPLLSILLQNLGMLFPF